jgi:Polyketide cyclase / dehydrase and lipid transport
LLGGFHLSGAAFEPAIEPTVAAFAEMAPDLVVPADCTGWKAQHRLAAALPAAFAPDAEGRCSVDDKTRVRYADKPTTEVHTWIDASPELVWILVSDINLMPTLSDELCAVEWVQPATGPAVGSAFRGYSQQGTGQWSTVSTIVSYQPGREFAWAVGDVANPGAIWKFALRPERGGTELSQWVQMGPGRSGVSMAIASRPQLELAIVAGRLRNFARGMAHNLAAIKTMAEQH